MKIKVVENKLMQQGASLLMLSTMDYNYYIRNMPMETKKEKIDNILNRLKDDLTTK